MVDLLRSNSYHTRTFNTRMPKINAATLKRALVDCHAEISLIYASVMVETGQLMLMMSARLVSIRVML